MLCISETILGEKKEKYLRAITTARQAVENNVIINSWQLPSPGVL